MRFLPSATVRRTAAGAMVLSAWLYYSQSLAPLSRQAEESARKLGKLREQLDSANKALRCIKDAEQEAGEARASLNRQLSERSHDSVMVAFPQSITKHFAGFGLPPSVIRLNTIQPEPQLAGYQRAYWSVGLPISKQDANLTGLLLAVAEFDRQVRFGKVVDFTLQPDPEDPHGHIASVNIVALIRK